MTGPGQQGRPVLQVRGPGGSWENLAAGDDPKDLATVQALPPPALTPVLHAIGLYLNAGDGQGGVDGPARADKGAVGWGVSIRAK